MGPKFHYEIASASNDFDDFSGYDTSYFNGTREFRK